MIRSMTGFGQAERSVQGWRIRMDMRSVNHRFREISVRMPREWLHLEEPLKKRVENKVKRGRIDVFVTIERDPSAGGLLELDWALIEGYIEAAGQIAERTGLKGLGSVSELLGVPGLVRMNEPEPDEGAQAAMMACADEALDQLAAMRLAEGENLKADLVQRIHTIEQLHREMEALYPQSLDQYRAKLRERIAELLGDAGAFDEQRFAMEVAVMAERTNIDEELTRLRSHLDQFRNALESDEPVGRKLDFLIQEMNREVNTIGAKSTDNRLIQQVVDVKAELEKIREQVQNIE